MKYIGARSNSSSFTWKISCDAVVSNKLRGRLRTGVCGGFSQPERSNSTLRVVWGFPLRPMPALRIEQISEQSTLICNEATLDRLTDFGFTSKAKNPPLVCWSRCAVKGDLFQRVQVLPRQRSSQPGSYPNGCGGNEAVEAWETESGFGPLASRQAVTCVNAESAPKYTMRRPTLPGLGEGWYESDRLWTTIRFASPGWWATACRQGIDRNTGSPSEVAGDRLGHQA